MADCPREFLTFAGLLADRSGRILRHHFRRSLAMESKYDGSVVTAADREAEMALREVVQEYYPTHGVVGEEFPPMRADAEFIWLVDPLDGTDAFVSGIPSFGFLLALIHGNRFILGLIDQPIVGDRWIGADGHGTTFNGSTVRTRRCVSLREAVLFSHVLSLGEDIRDEAIVRLHKKCRRSHFGVECYSYGLLAAGFFDLIVDHGLDIYDLAPLEPVVRNAGGALLDWQGSALQPGAAGAVLGVGDSRLLDEVLSILHYPNACSGS